MPSEKEVLALAWAGWRDAMRHYSASGLAATDPRPQPPPDAPAEWYEQEAEAMREKLSERGPASETEVFREG